MKKWICAFICLGYITSSLATEHTSFLTTGEDLQEMSFFEHILETPSFFSRIYPHNLNPNSVLVPRKNSGFEVGFIGMFQRPFDNQLDYAISEAHGAPFFLVTPGSAMDAVRPDYKFGYGAYLGYIYPYTGRELKLTLFNFAGATNDSTYAAGNGIVWTPLAPYDLLTIADSALARLDINVQQAKLMVGQQVYGGSHLRLRPGVGAKYALIDRELDTHYPIASAPPVMPDVVLNSWVQQKNRFNGLGPAVQLDGTYFFTRSLGLAGHITSAILLGHIKSKLLYTSNRTPSDSAQINLPQADRTVPNVDGQLALAFRRLFCGSHTILEMELGYQFSHFFNAIDTYRTTGMAALKPPALPFTATHIKHVHDLTLEGPYLSLGLSGLACPSDVVIDPVLVTIPQLEGGFIFGIGAGYFRTRHNQLDYALLDPAATSFLGDPAVPVPSATATLKTLNPNNAYGLMLTAGYQFPRSPYDLQAHFREAVAKESARLTAPTTGVIWTTLSSPIFDVFETRSYARRVNANTSFNYHDANIEVGQTICADSLIWLRVFAGLQYASINADLNTTYGNVSVPLTDVIPGIIIPQETVSQKSDFSGVGPRLGVDMALPVGGFALSSQLAGGVLIGSTNSSYNDQFPAAPLLGPVTLEGGHLGAVVNSGAQTSPYVNVKVGLAYTFDFFNRTRWVVDMGYLAVHYFNAATMLRHATNSAGVYLKEIQDVSLDGPYLNLTVSGIGACPPDCMVRQPYTAFAPILQGGFEFAAEELYLQIYAMNTDYGIADPLPALILPQSNVLELVPSNRAHMRVLCPGHEFGYRLHVGYIFPLSANDVALNYASLGGSTVNSTNADPTGVIWTVTNGNYAAGTGAGVLPAPPSLPFPVIANRADASLNFKWQTGNLELGRRLTFYALMARFFAGLTYAKVIENINITYTDGFTNTSPTAPFASLPVATDIFNQGNSYYGLGPRLGVSADLALGCGFSFVGQAGTDLLIGSLQSQMTETSSAGVGTTLDPQHRTRLVPAFDTKLGFAYTVPFHNQQCSQFSIELGYQFNHYFNVKDSLRFTDNFSTFLKQDQDLSFGGPYLRLQLDV